MELIFKAKLRAMIPARPTSFWEIFSFRNFLLSGKISAIVTAPSAFIFVDARDNTTRLAWEITASLSCAS